MIHILEPFFDTSIRHWSKNHHVFSDQKRTQCSEVRHAVAQSTHPIPLRMTRRRKFVTECDKPRFGVVDFVVDVDSFCCCDNIYVSQKLYLSS